MVEGVADFIDVAEGGEDAVERAGGDVGWAGESGEAVAADGPDVDVWEGFEVAPEAAAGDAAEAEDFPGRVGAEESVAIGEGKCLEGFAEAAGGIGEDGGAEGLAEVEDFLAFEGFEVADEDDESLIGIAAEPAGEGGDVDADGGGAWGGGGEGGEAVFGGFEGFVEFDVPVDGGAAVP